MRAGRERHIRRFSCSGRLFRRGGNRRQTQCAGVSTYREGDVPSHGDINWPFLSARGGQEAWRETLLGGRVIGAESPPGLTVATAAVSRHEVIIEGEESLE